MICYGKNYRMTSLTVGIVLEANADAKFGSIYRPIHRRLFFLHSTNQVPTCLAILIDYIVSEPFFLSSINALRSCIFIADDE